MKHFPRWGSTDFRRHSKTVIRHGEQAPWICEPMHFDFQNWDWPTIRLVNSAINRYVQYVPADWFWQNHCTWITDNLLTYLLTYLLTCLFTELLTYLFIYWLTYSMEQSPSWEANWSAASQEIPRILWNPKVYYRIHKCSPLVPILGQLDPVHTPTSHFLKIHLNIIIPSTSGSFKWPLFLRFPHRNPLDASALPIRATCPPIWFFYIWSPEQFWVSSTDD